MVFTQVICFKSTNVFPLLTFDSWQKFFLNSAPSQTLQIMHHIRQYDPLFIADTQVGSADLSLFPRAREKDREREKEEATSAVSYT